MSESATGKHASESATGAHTRLSQPRTHVRVRHGITHTSHSNTHTHTYTHTHVQLSHGHTYPSQPRAHISESVRGVAARSSGCVADIRVTAPHQYPSVRAADHRYPRHRCRRPCRRRPGRWPPSAPRLVFGPADWIRRWLCWARVATRTACLRAGRVRWPHPHRVQEWPIRVTRPSQSSRESPVAGRGEGSDSDMSDGGCDSDIGGMRRRLGCLLDGASESLSCMILCRVVTLPT